MSLLTAPVVKNSDVLPGIYLFFLKKLSLIKREGLQYEMWT